MPSTIQGHFGQRDLNKARVRGPHPAPVDLLGGRGPAPAAPSELGLLQQDIGVLIAGSGSPGVGVWGARPSSAWFQPVTGQSLLPWGSAPPPGKEGSVPASDPQLGEHTERVTTDQREGA